MEGLGWKMTNQGATRMEFSHPNGARARLYLDEYWEPPQWTVAWGDTVMWRGWDWWKGRDTLVEAAKRY
jgi:hypothetical protein